MNLVITTQLFRVKNVQRLKLKENTILKAKMFKFLMYFQKFPNLGRFSEQDKLFLKTPGNMIPGQRNKLVV